MQWVKTSDNNSEKGKNSLAVKPTNKRKTNKIRTTNNKTIIELLVFKNGGPSIRSTYNFNIIAYLTQ